jgi:HK97 family phage portal protein
VTLLGGLFRRSFEDPSMPLSDHSLAEWLTGARSDAGVAVTEKRVLGLPAYYRALVVTAGTVAGLPLHQHERAGGRVQTPWVMDAPNPRQTPIEYKMTTLLHGLAWGNGISRKVRDGSGIVREVWPIHPSAVQIHQEEPTAEDPAGKVFEIRLKSGEQIRRRSWDILHTPFVSFDGLSGVRPLELFRQSLGLAIAGDDSTAKFMANGSRLSGILSSDKNLDQPAADRLKARWKQLTGGVQNAGEIAVLDNGATFTPVSIPPADAQLLQSRQWMVTEIARMVGTPPHLIGDVSGSTSWGTGIEQQVLGWVKFTLQMWITSMEQRWAAELLPPSRYVKHSLEGLLRGDSAARAAFYHQAITDGWMTRNEVRQLEDRDPGPDSLDEYLAPSNMTLISVDGQIVPLSSDGVAAAGTA